MSPQVFSQVRRASIRQLIQTYACNGNFTTPRSRIASVLRVSFPRSVYTQPLVRASLTKKINCQNSGRWYPRFSASSIRRCYSDQAEDFTRPGLRSSLVIIWTFIGLNTAIFITWQIAIIKRDKKLGMTLQEFLTLSITNMKQQRPFTMITSAFSHINFVHFVFNMVAFHSFATALAIVAGVAPHHLVALSLLSAFGASSAWLRQRVSLVQLHRQETGGDITRKFVDIPALGASGIVMGLGSALACLTPFLPMNFMFIPISVPLWAVTVAYAGADYFLMDKNTGIGHSAHLGGAVVGIAYYAIFLRKLGGVWWMLKRRL
nr:uncharacterized protein c13e7.11 [Quercus suber]